MSEIKTKIFRYNIEVYMVNTVYKNIKELAKTDYFFMNQESKLELKTGIVEEIIDGHTHLGWSFFVAKPIDLLKKSKTKHFFPEECSFTVDNYSAFNFDKKHKRRCQVETVRGLFSSTGYSSTHTAPNLLEEMKRMRVNQAVVLAIDPLTSSRHTKQILSVASKIDNFIPFIALPPLAVRKKNKLLNYIKKGAKGIKVHPAIQMTKPTNKRYYTVYRLAHENKLPVFFHTGYSPLTPKIEKRFVKKEDFAQVIKDFPKVNFVLGHSGIDDYEYMANLGKKYDNAWLDLNGQPPKAIKKIISIMGDDKVFFGSDWPYYPIAISLVKALIATEGNKKTRQKILSKNIKKLLA